MSEPDLVLLFRALSFAAEKHQNQRRKGQTAPPYLNHPIGVARVLSEDADITNTDILCAALLHDTVEDTDTSPEELHAQFGPAITGMVMDVTDDKQLPKAKRKQKQIEHAAELSHGAKLIKLADKICNVRDMAADPPVSWSLQRRQEYFDWALKVIDQIRGTHLDLEALFDAAYQRRPVE